LFLTENASSSVPAAAVREAHTAGQRVFGESYLQEALPKLAALADLALEWHFIGPVQGNKTRQIAAHFAWVHGVDRLQIAQRLSTAASGRDAAAAGVHSGQCQRRGEQVRRCAGAGAGPGAGRRRPCRICAWRGFMAIPEPGLAARLQHERFRQVADLLQAARAEGLELDTLSMGMSADLEAAIAEGATWVRVGTAIFGERQANEYNQQEQVS
jgi:uncharacterized pyridoxal phosphate-containing UPF0001 family protein